MVRLLLHDGTVRVGGYVGANNSVVTIADPVSGEISEVNYNLVRDLDARKYNR